MGSAEMMHYATPKGSVDLVVDVPYEACPTCGYRGFGEAGERARTEAIYRYHHRLEPWAIAGIRQRLGMTQKKLADFLSSATPASKDGNRACLCKAKAWTI